MSTPINKYETGSSRPSLDQSLLRWTFGAVAVGMLLYSMAEYVIERPANGMDFFTHHLLHVLVIGFVVWAVLVFVVRRAVVVPASRIFVHLRRIDAGRLEYLECEVQSREMGEVVASINSLVSTLKRAPKPDSASRAMDRLQELRKTLIQSGDHLGDDLVPAMRIVKQLEGELLEVLQETGDRMTSDQSGMFSH